MTSNAGAAIPPPAHVVRNCDQFLVPVRRGANEDQQALAAIPLVLQADVYVNSVGSHVHLAVVAEVTAIPLFEFRAQGLFESHDHIAAQACHFQAQ